MADEGVVRDGAGGAVVRVGARDHPDVERIDAQPLLLFQPRQPGAAQEVAARHAAIGDRPRSARPIATIIKRRPTTLLEVTLLIHRTDDPRESRATLRVALVLVDLGQWLDRAAQRGLRALGREISGRIFRQEHLAVALVRVVRDRQHVATAAGVAAGGVERIPELLTGDRLEHGRRHGHLVAAEQDVTVQGADRLAGGVLVANQAGEGAGRSAVVDIRGSVLHFVPHQLRRRIAAQAIGATDTGMSLRVWHGSRQRHGSRPAVTTHPIRRTGRSIVRPRSRRRAQADLTQELGMVGHRGEIERAIDLQRLSADTVHIERR